MPDLEDRLLTAVTELGKETAKLGVTTKNLNEKIDGLPCSVHVTRMERMENVLTSNRVVLNRWMGGLSVVIIVGIPILLMWLT